MNPRTCVGCRQKADATELIRIVIDDSQPGKLLVDRRRQFGGRGAHLHPTTACLDMALKRRAFPRALRWSGSLHSEELEAYVAEADSSLTRTRDPIGDGSR